MSYEQELDTAVEALGEWLQSDKEASAQVANVYRVLATARPLTNDEIGDLVGACFAAGYTARMRQEIQQERDEVLRDYTGVMQ